MPSRVTQGMLNTQLISNISKNMKQMNVLQNQLSTGKRINAPSDDPVGITFSMRYRSELAANDQYQRNTDAAVSNLDYIDTMLDQAGQVLHRVRELAVTGSNGSNPQTALDAIKIEVEEMYEQMIDIGNSKFKGKYVFNGQLTDNQPYSAANAKSEMTDNYSLEFEVGAGLKIPVNITGNEAFGMPDEPDNVFQIMKDMIANLESGNQTGIEGAMDLVDSRMEKLLDARSTIGARTNRIDLVQGRLKDINVNLQELQSKTEDADMAIVITNLKMAENVYQAALSAGAQLIRPSLVDFMR